MFWSDKFTAVQGHLGLASKTCFWDGKGRGIWYRCLVPLIFQHPSNVCAAWNRWMHGYLPCPHSLYYQTDFTYLQYSLGLSPTTRLGRESVSHAGQQATLSGEQHNRLSVDLWWVWRKWVITALSYTLYLRGIQAIITRGNVCERGRGRRNMNTGKFQPKFPSMCYKSFQLSDYKFCCECLYLWKLSLNQT